MKTCLQLLLIYIFLFLAGCSPQTQSGPTTQIMETEVAAIEQTPEPFTEVVQVDASLIPVEELMNATYSGIYDEPITLTDGSYEGESFVEDDPSRPIVKYVKGAELFDDLDGDGIEDAVVFLLERGGGTAAFTYIAAQLNQNGQPVDAGVALVEDRTQIRSATIDDGQVVLDITTRGLHDGDCCPSYKTRKIYTLESGTLVEITNENPELVKISYEDLNGTKWTLLELNYDEPVQADSKVGISFEGNQITGFGGCNSYNSSFRLSDDNPFVITIEAIFSTKKACPDPILNQENIYFKILEGVSLWGYDHGKLVLFYVDKQGDFSRLLFAPQIS